MTQAINIYEIYSRVCNRKNKGSIAPGARLAADQAAETAALLLRCPNATTLAGFREAEKHWARLAGGDNKSYADEFESALRSGNYVVKRQGVNSAWSKNYDPEQGFIYGAASLDRPSWIKLGSTTAPVLQRLEGFARKYQLRDIRLIFHARVYQPNRVEREVHQRLRTYREQMSGKDSREWFNVSARHAMQTAEDAIESLGVRRIGPMVPSSYMKTVVTVDICPTGWIEYGARLVDVDETRSQRD